MYLEGQGGYRDQVEDPSTSGVRVSHSFISPLRYLYDIALLAAVRHAMAIAIEEMNCLTVRSTFGQICYAPDFIDRFCSPPSLGP